MKKLRTILCTVAGALIIFSLCGCYNGGTFTNKSYKTEAKNVNSVVIDVSDREIETVVSEDGQIRIDYCESEKEYYDISVSESGTLSMSLVLDKEWTDFIGTKPSAKYRKIVLYIPDGTLQTLKIKTTNEKIAVSPVSVIESADFYSQGGDIGFERIAVGKSLTAEVKNGNITGKITGGWDDFSIVCEIKKGNSNLPERKTEGEKSLTAKCNNGNIQIDFIDESLS